MREETYTLLVFSLLLFTFVGFAFIFVHLIAGKLLRPAKPDSEKMTIYECGEPTIGTAWIQFDLRFYVVALLFVIFDVEVAFFFPWAVVFGKANALSNESLPKGSAVRMALSRDLITPGSAPLIGQPGPQPSTEVSAEDARDLAWIAFGDIAVFFGVLLVGFAYLWRRGDLDWVRSTAAEQPVVEGMAKPPPPPTRPAEGVLAGAGH